MAAFDQLQEAPRDPILGLALAFKEDLRPTKVNLGVGAYKDSHGQPLVLNSVRRAEQYIQEQHLNKEYPPIPGNQAAIDASIALVFGDEGVPSKLCGVQTLGGTGALRIGGEFLARNRICSTIYLSDPTWNNHFSIFRNAGLEVRTYRYYDAVQKSVSFQALCDDVRLMPPGSAILLQPCCHNPTGADPSFAQWQELSALIKEKNILPFFDIAYQGFGCGLDEDAQVIRLFARSHAEMLVAGSYSKNMGLYGERAGYLAILCTRAERARTVDSLIKQVIRCNYSMPPLHAGRIVSTILTSPLLRAEWFEELSAIRKRIGTMRKLLTAGLNDHRYHYLSKQTGMFSLLDITCTQARQLRSEKGIYLLDNGRINIAGLNEANLDRVVEAILSLHSST